MGQAGEGEPWGRRTGAKALFCLAADGKEEKGKRDDEELELPGIVGLEGITVEARALINLMSDGHSIRKMRLITAKMSYYRVSLWGKHY